MDITGLDMTQISQKLATYVKNHVNGFTLAEGESLFAECYMLYFEEVKERVPDHYHAIFDDEDIFNGAAGFVEVDGREWVILMLADEKFTKVYLLSMQDDTDVTRDVETVFIKDFLD